MDGTDRVNIPVKRGTKDRLLKGKMRKQAKLGRSVTWDEYLLGDEA